MNNCSTTTNDVLEIVASNGWFPWYDNLDPRQNVDYSHLRLTSRHLKDVLDQPSHGGPDFSIIVRVLDKRNGFNKKAEYGYEARCKHDPRIKPRFNSLPPRIQAMKLLSFQRWVVSNFITQHLGGQEDITLADPGMAYGGEPLMEQLKQYNEPIYNFMHHLLFFAWAEIDLSNYPGEMSPYYSHFLGEAGGASFDYEHRETFCEDTMDFLDTHKVSDEEKKTIDLFLMTSYAPSQIQYIPETIRRSVMNRVDKEAVAVLGKGIANSIDLDRPVKETYQAKMSQLEQINWMPCLGEKAAFQPLRDFSGYNPSPDAIF